MRQLFLPKWEISNRNNKTYIVPTAFGFIFGVVCLFLLMMALGYANNLLYFLVFFLISVALSAMLETNKNMDQLAITDIYTGAIFAGEPQEIFVTIEKLSDLPSYDILVKIDDDFSWKSSQLSQRKNSISVNYQSNKRGFNKINKISIQSDFPFSLLTAWKNLFIEKKILIYPQKKGNLPLPKSKPEQIHTENIGIFKTLRDYQTTDLASRIDWRSSMKHQNLLVRSFEPQGPQIISIDWIDLDPSMPFEEKICQLAKWIYQLSNDGAEYSFCVGTRIFGPGKGPAHMHACLEFLSLLESDLDIGHLNV